MDVCRFLNSRDVAGHLRKIGYEPDAMESAYMVERSVEATLGEKFAAWQEIIGTMPDCPIPWIRERGKFISAHEFLDEYIGLQRRMLEMFEDGSGCVYFLSKARCRKWPEWLAGGRKSLWADDWPRPFSSLLKCIEHLRKEIEEGEEDEFDRYVIAKERIDSLDANRQNEIVLDGSFRPLAVDVSGLGERDRDVRDSLRDAFVELPVPFMCGDLVIDRTDPSPHPFAFDRLKFWDSSEAAEHGCKRLSPERAEKLDRRVAHADEKRGWDASHMVACGYELGGDYRGGPLADPCDLAYDVFGACANYLDLERYDGPLDGERRVLKVASEAMRGEIDFGLAMNLARLNALQAGAERLRRSYGSEYVEPIRDLY